MKQNSRIKEMVLLLPRKSLNKENTNSQLDLDGKNSQVSFNKYLCEKRRAHLQIQFPEKHYHSDKLPIAQVQTILGEKNKNIESKKRGNSKQIQFINEDKHIFIPYFLQCFMKNDDIFKEAIMHVKLSIMTFKTLQQSSGLVLFKGICNQITPQVSNRKTIVFDMDETLIHTNQHITEDYQIKVPFKQLNNKHFYGYVCVRPYAKQILKKLSIHFDIIIFTAGSKKYADPILDHIDPQKVIQHRLYRQNCSLINKSQTFVKDLRILGRNLKNVVLVDNSPHAYLLQPNNGIPILPYYKGKQDTQLYSLEKYLMSLKDVNDVRVINRQTFQLHNYTKYQQAEQLVISLYKRLFKINQL